MSGKKIHGPNADERILALAQKVANSPGVLDMTQQYVGSILALTVECAAMRASENAHIKEEETDIMNGYGGDEDALVCMASTQATLA